MTARKGHPKRVFTECVEVPEFSGVIAGFLGRFACPYEARAHCSPIAGQAGRLGNIGKAQPHYGLGETFSGSGAFGAQLDIAHGLGGDGGI